MNTFNNFSKLLFYQFIKIGFYSVLIVSITSFSVGFVLVLQSFYAFGKMNANYYAGNIVLFSMLREIGPVLSSIIIASRTCGSIAAEIGSMKVTEQIDAMKMLNVNPYYHLVYPKVIASIIMFPMLCLLSAFIGILGGYVCSMYIQILYNVDIFSPKVSDIFICIIKSSTFGLISSVTSCYYGMSTENSSSGVGISVTKTVVTSSVLILLINCFYTWLFLDLS